MSTVNLKSSAPLVDERAPKKNKKASSHPRAPAGSKVPKTGAASSLDTGATEDPFQYEDQDDPSLDAKAPLEEDDDLGSLDPFKFEDQLAELDAGPSLDAAPLGEDVDLGSLVPFQYEDPLAETADVGSTLDHIHIRIQQRNGRKTLTTLQGLPKDVKVKKLLKAFKKEFACNGTIAGDEMTGTIIQLQGDQRTKILNFLIEQGVPKDTIKKHGF